MSLDGFLAGLADEMEIDLAPFLLGNDERIFDGAGDLSGLELGRAVGRAVAAPQVVHLEVIRA